MSNPVGSRFEREWKAQSTPQNAGLATLEVAADQPVRYDQAAFSQAQASYYAPAADGVDTGRMTYDDVIVKTATCLGLLVVGGAISWWAGYISSGLQMGLMLLGVIAGFVLAMVNIFSRTVRPQLILLYSTAEGLALGAISQVTEAAIPGIVLQAVVATVSVFAVTLILFASGKVRNSSKLMKVTLIGLIGLVVMRGLIWLFSMFGFNTGEIYGYYLFGIPLAAIIGVVAVFLGALCLIGDFDQAKTGVNLGMPRNYAWLCAFSMMVTVVWMYVELLRLLSVLNSNN